jgi:hypothetical protein
MRKTSQEWGRWHDILQRVQTGANCAPLIIRWTSGIDIRILSHNAAIFIHAFNHRLGRSGEIGRNCGLRKFSPRFQGNGLPIAIIASLQTCDFTGQSWITVGRDRFMWLELCTRTPSRPLAHVAGCRCLSWRCNARARLTMCHAVEKVSVCRSDCCQA